MSRGTSGPFSQGMSSRNWFFNLPKVLMCGRYDSIRFLVASSSLKLLVSTSSKMYVIGFGRSSSHFSKRVPACSRLRISRAAVTLSSQRWPARSSARKKRNAELGVLDWDARESERGRGSLCMVFSKRHLPSIIFYFTL